jgi:hypothetical protein
MVNLSPQPIFQVIIGVAIIVWYFWGINYRMKEAAKYDIGFLDVDLPQWHENMSWPLIILLLLGLYWGTL